MKIWVDADACPQAVAHIVCRASQRRRIPVCLVSSSPVHASNSPLLTTVIVDPERSATTEYIIEEIEPEDIIVTADASLAETTADMGALAIDPRRDLNAVESACQRFSSRPAGGPTDCGRLSKAFNGLLTQ